MTTDKKGPSKMKLVDEDKGTRKDQETLEKIFETQRQGILATLEVQLKQDLRFDTLMGIREAWQRFHFDRLPEEAPDFEYIRNIAADVREKHLKIQEAAEAMTLEQFTAEDWINPADALVEFDEPKEWEDVFYQSVIFSGVMTYGQSFDDIRSRMMKELKDRA